MAGLNYGVATNETVAGYIANNFFLSQARSAGLSLTETQLYTIGVDLMRAAQRHDGLALSRYGNRFIKLAIPRHDATLLHKRAAPRCGTWTTVSASA
jgi:hypothetical protein